MEIYVGNLAYATTDEGLKAAFAQFGEVTAVRAVASKIPPVDLVTGKRLPSSRNSINLPPYTLRSFRLDHPVDLDININP